MKNSMTILLLVILLGFGKTADAQSEPFIGQISMFAGNFAPRGWAICDGQLLSVAQNSALFSILGTTYGGDGRTTFALPDLRGRVPINPGSIVDNGGGIMLGQKGGTESVELRKVSVLEKVNGKTYETYTVRKGNKMLHTRDPYIGINYIIALQGTYPSRN
jgi:microcystin-dependent protein